MPSNHRLLVYPLDIILIVLSYSLALLLNNDFSLPALVVETFPHTILYVVAIQALVFITSNLYRSLWKYASLHDAIEIFKTVSIASILSGLGLLFLYQESQIARVVLVLDWGILLVLMLASRFVWRYYRESHLLLMHRNDRNGNAARTLIVGAGDAGSMLLREILKRPASPYRVMGFVDDAPVKQHMRIMGLEVLGTTAQLRQLIDQLEIEHVIIAMSSAGPKLMRNLMNQCIQSGAKFKIIPSLSELIRGEVKISNIRDVAIDDLLGRSPVNLDEHGIANYLKGMRVLVSGAAGSIGSEICRQVARYSPSMLVLLDNAETPLFYIEQELIASFPELRLVAILGDVRNRERLEQVFDEIRPEVVFHAAAYKHVPMVEHNPAEAVLCNVAGSMNLATVSQKSGVRNFVLISTDKAVNPTNVMGTTKRVTEKYIQVLADGSKTRFSTVRFGNVLGSNGSVIPIFTEQIRKGGPITITHPGITRYFMTIPEASQLVLQSACYGKGGEIFVLDMGEPVSIVELAEELVRLSGLTPYADIEFVYTGLRPGEKLYEELFCSGEIVLKTPNEKIHVLAPVSQNYELLHRQIERLIAAARENDIDSLLNLLCEIVPEYCPSRLNIPAKTDLHKVKLLKTAA
jgi:FlaA1/EpsC-like NDP-sugar epimerase